MTRKDKQFTFQESKGSLVADRVQELSSCLMGIYRERERVRERVRKCVYVRERKIKCVWERERERDENKQSLKMRFINQKMIECSPAEL